MPRVRIVERAEELPEIRELWEELWRARRADSTRTLDQPTLFQSYAFNEIAARVFAERERPHVVVVESGSAAVIIPACVRRDSISLLGEELFDYRRVLGDDAPLLERAWEEIARLGLPLEIKAVRGAGTMGLRAQAFAGAAYRRACERLLRNKQVERNWRRMAEQGLEYRGIGPSGDRASAVRRMYARKGQSESGSLFQDALRVEAVAQMAATWESEVHTIERQGELAAAILTFMDGAVCRFYGTYYDARWAQYSPGIALLDRVVREAQARGLDFDFMTGEQSYKLRFATEIVPLFTVHGFEAAGVATAS